MIFISCLSADETKKLLILGSKKLEIIISDHNFAKLRESIKHLRKNCPFRPKYLFFIGTSIFPWAFQQIKSINSKNLNNLGKEIPGKFPSSYEKPPKTMFRFPLSFSFLFTREGKYECIVVSIAVSENLQAVLKTELSVDVTILLTHWILYTSVRF